MAKRADVIVLGLGAMGTATLAELARRGVRAIGIEKEEIVPHDRGSSHGRSRVIRKAYFEHPSYVPLLLRSYDLWTRLEEETGERILFRTGCLTMGPPAHEIVRGVRDSVERHGLAHDLLDAREIHARFPGLVASDGDVGVYEEDGGLLVPERSVAAQLAVARQHGAEVRLGERVAEIEASAGEGVAVRTQRHRYEASRLVVCAGAWLGSDGFPLAYGAPLVAMRQVQLWFAPTEREPFEIGRMPCFIHADGERAFYGLPIHDASDVKVCRHYGGTLVHPDALPREATHDDAHEVREWLRAHAPLLAGPPTDARVCMYGVSPDAHFVVGPHPEHSRVILAGGFSGHGFKLAPVVGEIAADLATSGATSHDAKLFDPTRFTQ